MRRGLKYTAELMRSDRHHLIRRHPDAEGHMNTADRLIHKHNLCKWSKWNVSLHPCKLSGSSFNCGSTKLLKAFSSRVLLLQLQNSSRLKCILCVVENITWCSYHAEPQEYNTEFLGHRKLNMIDLWLLVQPAAPMNTNKNTSTVNMPTWANLSLQNYVP